MARVTINAEVLLVAFGLYAAIVLALTLWNARHARLDSSSLDEAGPRGHVLHECRSQSLVGQIFGGDR